MAKKIDSLYIHIPFCKKICFYCDFPKMLFFAPLVKKYLTVLLKELALLKIKHKLKTIYIGGGTPTCVDLKPLLVKLQPLIGPNTEFTVEGDVLDFNQKKLKEYRKYHVNRISLGIQSTDNQILKILGRQHTCEDIFTKVKLIKKFFSNINADLIYGFSDLNMHQLQDELKDYLQLGFQHISTYSLEINPGTLFFNQHKPKMNDEQVRKQFDFIYHFLSKNGFHRYEISNFAKKKCEAKHNLTYWKNENYYGIGLGAASFINNYRIKNTLNLNEYLQGKFILNREKITPKENEKYYLMLNLRLTKGINLKKFQQKFKYDLLIKKKEIIQELVKQKLLKMNKFNLCTSYDGSMLLNFILIKLL